jgi:hypothetical protein
MSEIKRSKGRPSKYSTEEEKHEAHLKAMAKYRLKNKKLLNSKNKVYMATYRAHKQPISV